jgi:hypothetical protein
MRFASGIEGSRYSFRATADLILESFKDGIDRTGKGDLDPSDSLLRIRR